AGAGPRRADGAAAARPSGGEGPAEGRAVSAARTARAAAGGPRGLLVRLASAGGLVGRRATAPGACGPAPAPGELPVLARPRRCAGGPGTGLPPSGGPGLGTGHVPARVSR